MIEVLSGGGLNTVQDLGRYGYRKIGVSVAGAMDKLALAAGNLALGNDLNSAGIEVTIFPFRVRFLNDAVIAVTGAACTAELDGRPLLPWWVTPVSRDQVLALSTPESGSRVYLSVCGGIDVPVILNSRSTDLKAGFGGHEGRPLRKGDRLTVLPARDATAVSRSGFGIEPPHVGLPLNGAFAGSVTVRVLPAAEYERFPEHGQVQFWSSEWQITANSNRQGYRLAGAALPTGDLSEMLSHGLVPGTIQVPPSGQPIIQMSDANTSGGYPKIGTVIEADMWRLAQAQLGEKIRFVETTLADAIDALAAERKWLQTLAASVATMQAGNALTITQHQ